jgi:p-hydroxybenzoate 3-monooxygenase
MTNEAQRIRTQVGIVGAGPAGLILAQLLHREGVDSVVIEAQSRQYVQERIRAGVLEQGTVDLLNDAGVGDNMRAKGLVHRGIELAFAGGRYRLDLHELSGGRAITVYGQHEVVRDLVDARLARGGAIFFGARRVQVRDVESSHPRIAFLLDGAPYEIAADFIAGCDGSHGVCRPAMPANTFAKSYPFGWLGILAEAPPASPELIYASHERGFALLSMRSPSVTRAYIQCKPDEDIAAWPDDRIWEELRMRCPSIDLNEGPVLRKDVTSMRSSVCEPMQFGRLFLAGDAAHTVPPTGAKGMNLAAADVSVLARALALWYRKGDSTALENYSEVCLRRVWRVQQFSWWMTSMLHRFDGADAFDRKRQLAELEQVVTSRSAATMLAENYVGLPFAC